jgi:ATP-dependent Lon protease
MTEINQTELNLKVKKIFSNMVINKNPENYTFFTSLSIPPYIRDWLIMRFASDDGSIRIEEIREYVDKYIPHREQWELIKANMIHEGTNARFLAKIRVEMDVPTGKAIFSLPDFGFPKKKYEAEILGLLLASKKDLILSNLETWGVIDLFWTLDTTAKSQGEGKIFLNDFEPFCPYAVDLDFFRDARKEFSLNEWIDILLMAIDYNPNAFLTEKEKITLLTRLLPFLEKRTNLIELAPKSTGKSTIFSQISKHGWLVSGGSVSRARLFYDVARRLIGLVSRYDYVALDEIQSINFPDKEEMRGALKGYLENGEYRVGDYRGVGDSGFVLLGNIQGEYMDINRNMFVELPEIFSESALLDRFHGFIKGWDIPRMRDNMSAKGWSLNAEYFSEILHALREDIRYRSIVEELLYVPKGSDTRDTKAIKKLTTAYLKLFFPHITTAEKIHSDEFLKEFEKYCLEPAKQMRGIIRLQLHKLDPEYPEEIPEIKVKPAS